MTNIDDLRCPQSRLPLRLAPADMVERVNAAIAVGRLRNRGGEVVQTPLDGGLLRDDGILLYPIVDDIPSLMVDDAIPTDQISPAPLSSS